MQSYLILALSITFILGFVSIHILNLIYNEQSTPYIDEIFHISQAQKYCNGNWTEWNPKITTFPGLYLISFTILKPLGLLGYDENCTLYALRATNLLPTLLNFILALQIIDSLEKKYMVTNNAYKRCLSALNIAIFPPLYFFTFLYYTDLWSTMFVLLTYKLHLSEKKFSKLIVGLSSLMAVFMRQTNIIWIIFLILIKSWEILEGNVKTKTVQDFKYTKKVLCTTFFCHDSKRIKILIAFFISIFKEIYHLVFICALFVIFVIFNGGIVLGDKSAHTPTFHPMQNLYFLNFAAFFGLPFVLTEVRSVYKKPPNIFLIIFLIGLFSALSEANKIEHPYLLSDNRHLSFYIWKRLFGHHIIRRIIVPTYAGSSIFFFRILQKRCHFMIAVGLSACIFLNLTPQYLFELRYFIVPYIMWRLQFPQHSFVLLETIFFIILNISVIYLFLSKTFVWPSEPDVKQRFIW